MQDIYLDLIIRQYRKNNFVAYMSTFLSVLDNSMNYDGFLDLYDIEKAPSFALDVLGGWVGVDRYFSEGPMSDDDFRVIIKLKIARNQSNHSLDSIATLMKENLGDFIRVLDTDDMELVYYLDSSRTRLFNIALEKNVIPKPMGVSFRKIEVPDPFKLFGFYTGSTNTVGFSDFVNNDVKEGHFLETGDIK